MAAAAPDRLDPARAHLRRSQRAWAGAIVVPPSVDVLDLALAQTHRIEGSLVDEGEWLSDGVFRFAADSERRRWGKTREILHRIRPGPYEDPVYIEMLARQAAAVELFLCGDPEPSPKALDLLSRVVIGTTVAPWSQGSTTEVGGCSVIEISSGMMDLLYQSAKAIVLSWRPLEPREGVPPGFSTAVEDTSAVLDADPYPVDLLFDTLVAWLYEGRSRASYSQAPPPHLHPPLRLLINNSERFVLAHEYGHALMDQLAPTGDEASPWQKELRADVFGANALARSAADLDRITPTIALQGATLAMQAHDLLDAAVQIARSGEEGSRPGSETHPSFVDRLAVLEQFFLDASDDHEAARDQLPGLQVPSLTLRQLWLRVVPQLRAQYRAGRRLHPMWRRG